MYYGTNELAQVLETDGKVRHVDLIQFTEPEKPKKDEIIKCFYNNAYAISTHLYRLQAAKSQPADKLRIAIPFKTKVPRSLVGVRLSTILPGYAKYDRVRDWWLDNLEKLDKKDFHAVSGGYLERVIGMQCRAFTSSLNVVCDAEMDVDDFKLMFKFQRLLGIKGDPDFYTNFKLIVPLRNVSGNTIREKCKVLNSIKEHLRRRIYLVSDADIDCCLRTAKETGCRIAIWVEDIVQEGVSFNLKHKLISKIADLNRDNAGSSSKMLILTIETKASKLERMISYYAKNFGPVLVWKGKL